MMEAQPSCVSCGVAGDLYNSECDHISLCAKCARGYVEKGNVCRVCSKPVVNLTKEFNVRISPSTKQHSLGKFSRGLPFFGGKSKDSASLWTLVKETGILSSKDKVKAAAMRQLVLENDLGDPRFVGQPDMIGAQSNFFCFSMHAKEFMCMPAGNWYNFTKHGKYKTFSIEEAEDIMKGSRKKQLEVQNKWLQKLGSGKADSDTADAEGGSRRSRKSSNGDEADGEEDEEENDADGGGKPKIKSGKKKGADVFGDNDDDNNEGDKEDAEDDDGGGEKGEEWEHDENFTDDDEAVGVEKDEQENEDADMPKPPGLKDGEEEDEEDDMFLKEMNKGMQKKGKSKPFEDEDDEEEEGEENDEEAELEFSPIFQSTPKVQETAQPPQASVAPPAKPPLAEAKAAAGKRKAGTEKVPATKKSKQDSAKAEVLSEASLESEIRSILAFAPMKTKDLLTKFKGKLKNDEHKKMFAMILQRVGKISTIGDVKYISLTK